MNSTATAPTPKTVESSTITSSPIKYLSIKPKNAIDLATKYANFCDYESLVKETLKKNSTSSYFIRLLGEAFSNKSIFWYGLIMLVLLVILSVIVFVFCIGRFCMFYCHDVMSVNICPFFRPIEDEYQNKNVKLYESCICYSALDQHWLEEKFMPSFASFSRGFRISKLCLNHKNPNELFSDKNCQILKSSKRIVLILSKSMIEEWKNDFFRDLIRSMHSKEKNFVLILINVNSLDHQEIKKFINEIRSKSSNSSKMCNVKEISRMIFRVFLHNCGLNKIEKLNWEDKKFWKKLKFLMPFIKNSDRLTEISESSKKAQASSDSCIRNVSATQNVESSNLENDRSTKKQILKVENEIGPMPKKSQLSKLNRNKSFYGDANAEDLKTNLNQFIYNCNQKTKSSNSKLDSEISLKINDSILSKSNANSNLNRQNVEETIKLSENESRSDSGLRQKSEAFHKSNLDKFSQELKEQNKSSDSKYSPLEEDVSEKVMTQYTDSNNSSEKLKKKSKKKKKQNQKSENLEDQVET